MKLLSLEAVQSIFGLGAMHGHPTIHSALAASFTVGQGNSLWDRLFTSSTTIFAPQSAPAHEIFRLSMFVLLITGAIFVTVCGLLIYVILRYRKRANDDDREPPQIYGSNQIELAWTVFPILIIIVLFLTSVRIIYEIQDSPEPKQALNITVVGHQWWWEFKYPKYGVVTANELHVPVTANPKEPVPSYLKLVSADVDHSFWVPRLAGKTDLMAGQVNSMWVQPEKVGIYYGQCAQFCGTQHAKMLIRVYAETPADFQKWIANQQKPAVQDPSVAAGRAVFMQNACINCHTVKGTVANGRFGPDLTHLMSRDTIAAGTLPNTRANLAKWIEDPDAYKPGCLMPAMKLSDQDLGQLVSYLVTLK